MNSRTVIGAMLVFLAAVTFSAKAVIVKLALGTHQVDPVSLLTLRMAYSFPFFLLLGILSSKKSTRTAITGRDVALILFCGIVGYYLASLFDFLGLQYISAGLERLILFIYPTLVVLFMALFYKVPITRRIVLALVLSYAGVLFAFLHDFQRLEKDAITGALFIMGSAITYALYLAVGGQLIHRIGSMRFTALAMMVSVIAICVHFLMTRSYLLLINLSREIHSYAFIMAIVCTVLPAMFLAAGIKRIGSGPAAIIGSVGPVSTIILAYFLLGEPIDVYHMIGTALVLAGVLMVSTKKTTDA
ncbi:MAG: DMT family transporter [Leptospirales bacterium]|nr:DMT family transporter [Leptospirales bacterium]